MSFFSATLSLIIEILSTCQAPFFEKTHLPAERREGRGGGGGGGGSAHYVIACLYGPGKERKTKMKIL